MLAGCRPKRRSRATGGGGACGGCCGPKRRNAETVFATMIILSMLISSLEGFTKMTPMTVHMKTFGSTAGIGSVIPASSSAKTPGSAMPNFLRPALASKKTNTFHRPTMSATTATTGDAIDVGGQMGEDGAEVRELYQSMDECWKSCLFAATINAVCCLYGMKMSPPTDLKYVSVWTFGAITSAYKFALGAAIRHVTRIPTFFRDDPTSMTTAAVWDICRIMSGLWRWASWIIVLGSSFMAAALAELARTTRMVPRWMPILGALGCIGIRLASFRLEREVSDSMDAGASRRASWMTGDKEGKMVSADGARKRGLSAGRYVRMCTFAFGVLGVSELITTVAVPGHTPVQRLFGLADVAKDAVMVALLFNLESQWLNSVATATEDYNWSQINSKAYVYLYKSQTWFFRMATKTFIVAAILKLVLFSLGL